jgi:hypothetical protein
MAEINRTGDGLTIKLTRAEWCAMAAQVSELLRAVQHYRAGGTEITFDRFPTVSLWEKDADPPAPPDGGSWRDRPPLL